MIKAAQATQAETTKQTKVRQARRAFLLGIADLSWKLAGAFLIPTIVGVIADNSRNGSKTFTVVGVIIGFILSFLVIINVGLSSNKILDQENNK